MKKYLLSLVLFEALMLFGTKVLADDCPEGVVRCGVTEDGLSWQISNIKDENDMPVTLSDGQPAQQLTITGTEAMQEYSRRGENIAPWKDPNFVKGNSAPTISKIVIEEGITSIGVRAFEDMTSVRSVSLPDGLKSIDVAAFNCCVRLSEINLPSSLETLEGYAFYATRLSNIELPQNLQRIGGLAFGYNSHLSDITIPENTYIDKQAFEAESGAVFIQNVYCSGSNASCQDLKNRESMSGKVQFYHSDGGTYFYDNRWYASPNDILSNNHIKKRIYTVDEANKISGTTNTFKIRYK